MEKNEVIVSAVGKNRPGVLSEVTSAIASLGGNIMDISQKMVTDYFNLVMVVDVQGMEKEFSVFKAELEKLGEDKGYRVSVQHADVFRYMHRI